MDPMELLKEFYNLGCEDEKKCAIACRVYINLIEVCKHKNVERFYDEKYDEIYFKVPVKDEIKIYVPHSVIEDINLQRISELQKEYLKEDNYAFILSLCDPDSTVLYYRMTPEFVESDKIHLRILEN